MKRIKKNELYEHLGSFLKARGIELKEGSYAARIQRGCELLSDVINCTERGLAEAASQMDQGLDRMRDIIHRKTAPNKTSTGSPQPKPKQQTRSASRRRTAKAKKTPVNR